MVEFADLVDPEHTAVLVIDVQNDFCHPDGAQGRMGLELQAMRDVVPNIIAFVDEARRAGTPVIFVRNGNTSFTTSEAFLNKQRGSGGHHICLEGTWGAGLYGVEPRPDELVIVKTRYDAFIGTNLEMVLRNMGVKTVVLAGVTTNTCVETTARHAFVIDFNVVFLSDCTATHYPEEHQATLHTIGLNFGFVRSAAEVVEAWGELDAREAAPLAVAAA